MKSIYFGFFIVLWASCNYPQAKKETSELLRYRKNKNYEAVAKASFKRGERIFFKVPAFRFLTPDNFGNFLFNYQITVHNSRNKEIYRYSEKHILLNSKKIPNKICFECKAFSIAFPY